MLKIQDGFWSKLVKWQTKLLKIKKTEDQVVRYHQDLNFVYIQFFHLRNFKFTIPTKSSISHKLFDTICVDCGFSTTSSQHFFKCKNGLYIKCRFCWVEQYWYSWLFHSRPSRVSKTDVWLWILSKLSGSNFFNRKVDH